MTFLLDTFLERSRHGLSRKLTAPSPRRADAEPQPESRVGDASRIDPQVDDEVSRERALDLCWDFDRGFCDTEEDFDV